MLALGVPITAITQSTQGPATKSTYDFNTSDVTPQPITDSSFHTPSADRDISRPSDAAPFSSAFTLIGDNENENIAANLKRSATLSRDYLAELGPVSRVSVARGKSEFATLERRFSQHSRRSVASGFAKPDRVISNASVPDVEKGKKEEDEFDLPLVLRSGRERADEAGIKHKSVGVVWEDLEVIGAGGMKINIRHFSDAVMEQFIMPVIGLLGLVGYKPFAPKPRTIIYKNSGLLKPGEMCLVLGRPGSGCSTFLKSIANKRDGYLSVTGDVRYAGMGWKEMSKIYSGRVEGNRQRTSVADAL